MLLRVVIVDIVVGCKHVLVLGYHRASCAFTVIPARLLRLVLAFRLGSACLTRAKSSLLRL